MRGKSLMIQGTASSVGKSVLCVAAAALCLLFYRRMAYRLFGGVIGDLAGWFLQVTELAVTAVIVIGGKEL